MFLGFEQHSVFEDVKSNPNPNPTNPDPNPNPNPKVLRSIPYSRMLSDSSPPGPAAPPSVACGVISVVTEFIVSTQHLVRSQHTGGGLVIDSMPLGCPRCLPLTVATINCVPTL
jgi:hypothetical protein